MHSIEIRKLVLLLYQKGLSARATAYQVLHDCGKSVSPRRSPDGQEILGSVVLRANTGLLNCPRI